MKDQDIYMPNGEVQGDNKAIPDRGTGTGVSDTYGADLTIGATNRIGGITSDTKSDKDEELGRNDDAEDARGMD